MNIKHIILGTLITVTAMNTAQADWHSFLGGFAGGFAGTVITHAASGNCHHHKPRHRRHRHARPVRVQRYVRVVPVRQVVYYEPMPVFAPVCGFGMHFNL